MTDKTKSKGVKHGQNALDNELDVLKEILKWTKVTSVPHVKKLLEDTLSSDEERLAYHLSTGLTSREIASKVGVQFSTITSWWDKWHRLGIVDKVSAQRGERGVRAFDLNDFGIPIPKVIVSKKKEQRSAGEAGGRA